MKITIEVENIDPVAAQVLVSDAIAATQKAFSTPSHSHTIGKRPSRLMRVEIEV